MARRNHSPGTKPCTCNKCLATAVTPAGTTHRRCPVQPDQPLRPKGQGIEVALRGKWE